jgi:serine/threonine protein kinase/Tfp pilus assembly protein PilF
MSEQQAFERERELFHQACLLSADERAVFLEVECAGDPVLRGRLEALLAAEASPTLEPPLIEHGPSLQTIEGYQLLRKLGDGGMGEVWEAEQLRPIKRRVALKLIRWGMDTESVVRRFESERQALALMEHPAIAKVYAAGSTDQGRPYFAMELVAGIPITDYCDRRHLSVADRLRLFADVCRAVQHAHMKGIIHRDLKPANIMVCETDEGPQPKIIDFGIAKATERGLTEQSVFTELGQWIGTPEYMSPEQAAIGNSDIDTRTDVYSLGVVLYELLAGDQPLARDELRSAGFDEMRRRIQEQDPPRPSTRVRTTAADSVTVADRRKTSAIVLAKTLEGDLDWITMTALEKDRDRRYASPLELLADIDRYLKDEPVLAGPPGGFYRLGKFVRRHRVIVLAMAFSFIALLAGLGMATVGFVRARAHEQEAIAQAQTAEKVAGFLEEVFSLMDPGSEPGQSVSTRELLQFGSDRIEQSLHDQPEVRTRLMRTIGGVANNLGHYEIADPLLSKALDSQRALLGGDHPDLASTLLALGWSAYWQGDLDRALWHFEESVRVLEASGLQAGRVGLSARSAVGLLRLKAGDLDGSRIVLERMLADTESAFGPDDALVSDALLYLGHLKLQQGRDEEAVPLFERAAEIREELFGAEHQQWAFAAVGLGTCLRLAGEYEEARNLLSRSIDAFENAYGPEHPALAQALAVQANITRDRGDNEAAIRQFQRAVGILKKRFGADHEELAWILRALAVTYLRADNLLEAHAAAAESLRVARVPPAAGTLERARSQALLAFVEYRMEKYDKARSLYQQSLATSLLSVRPDDPNLRLVYYNLGCLDALGGEVDGALQWLEKAMQAGYDANYIFDDPDLDPLRGHPTFQRMVREVKRRRAG